MAEFPKAFLVGQGAQASLLPFIYRYWLQAYNLRGSYDAVPTAAESLPRFLADMEQKGFCGGTIAPPYQEAAFAVAEQQTEAAAALGAVDMVWKDNGRLHGGNSAAQGFLDNMDAAAAGGWAGEKAVILGAGAGLSAVVYALFLRGFRSVFIAAPAAAATEKAVASLRRAGAAAIIIGGVAEVNAHLPAAQLLVHMGGLGSAVSASAFAAGYDSPAAAEEAEAQAAEKPFGFMDFSLLPRFGAAADMEVQAEKTPFLRLAAGAGLQTADGLGALLCRAAPGFMQWFGEKAQISGELRSFIAAKLRAQASEKRAGI